MSTFAPFNYHAQVTACPVLSLQDTDSVINLKRHYMQLVASPDTRTLWYQGYPYGTAYQFATGTASGDVFGSVLTHSISSQNGVAMGLHVDVTDNNELAIGQYNITSAPAVSYAFCIGNGSSAAPSNAMTVETDGTVTAYRISKTQLDSSYVSTLGEKAELGLIMQALLTPADYYKPSFSFWVGKSDGDIARNCIAGHSFSNFTIGATWPVSTKPRYHYTYIDNYITKNSALPSGVTMNMLGYAACLTDRAHTVDNYSAEISSSITVRTGESTTTSVSVTAPKQDITGATTKLTAIYNGSSSFNFMVGGVQSYTIKGFTLTKPGITTVATGTFTFGYSAPQTTFFQQLVEQGVYVGSVSKAFKPGETSCGVNVRVYAGYTFVWGVVGSSTDYTVNSDGLKTLITDAMNGTANAAITGKIVKTALVTYQYNTGYLSTSNKKVYFGESKMGADQFTSGTFKYFFFAFAQGYFNASAFSNGHFIHQVATKGMAEQNFGDESVFENYKWTNATYTNSTGVNYKIYVAKSVASTLYFGDETDGGTNVFAQLNQTGLNTVNS